MAFKFNAILKFSANQAISQMNRTGRAFDKMGSGLKRTSAAMSSVGAAARSASLATAPLTLGVGLATKTAADFEEQMSIVRSVLLATPKEMQALNAVTKRLGATTAFTAKQAGEGAENLARAGFSSKQIVAALPGVLDAAAASGVSLGDASNIVAGQLGAFGLAAKDATNVADALALTTALTNTDFIELGEAMKFAAPFANQAGKSLEETAAAMGVLANAGVKGSLAGTAMKNALNKLAEPSKEAIALFGGRAGFNSAVLETVNVGGKLVQRLRPFEVIMANVAKQVQASKNPLETTAKAAEIFGLRGTTAFSAFSAKLQENTTITEKNINRIRAGIAKTGESIKVELGDSIPTLVALRFQIAGATGTAKEMARIRLENLKGQFTLFQSAVSGLSIEMGGLLTGPFTGLLKKGTDFLSVLAIGFQKATSNTALTQKEINEMAKSGNQFVERFGPAAVEFAQGFIEGFKELKEAAKSAFNTIQDFLSPIIGKSNLTAKEFGKIAAKVLAIGAIAAPVLGAIAIGLAILAPIISGLGTVFSAVGGVFSFVAGAMKFGLVKLVSLVGGLAKAWGFVVAAAKVVGAAVTAVIGVVGIKVIAVIAVIAAVVAAVVFFKDEIVGFFVSMFESIKKAVQPLIPMFRAIGAKTVEIFKKTVELVMSAWEPIKTFFSNLWQGVVTIAQFALNAIVQGAIAMGNAFAAVARFIVSVIEPLVPVFKFVGGLAVAIFKKTFEAIVAIWTPIKNFFVGLWGSILNAGSIAFNALVDNVVMPVVSTIKSVFKSVGNFILKVLTFPIRAAFSALKSAISTIAETSVGELALETAGINIDDLKKSFDVLPGILSSVPDEIDVPITTSTRPQSGAQIIDFQKAVRDSESRALGGVERAIRETASPAEPQVNVTVPKQEAKLFDLSKAFSSVKDFFAPQQPNVVVTTPEQKPPNVNLDSVARAVRDTQNNSNVIDLSEVRKNRQVTLSEPLTTPPDLRNTISNGFSGNQQSTKKLSDKINSLGNLGNRPQVNNINVGPEVGRSFQRVANGINQQESVARLDANSRRVLSESARRPDSQPTTINPQFTSALDKIAANTSPASISLDRESQQALATGTKPAFQPNVGLVEESLQTGIQNQRLSTESLRQTALAAPPSEQKIVQAIKRGQAGSTGSQGPVSGTVRLTGELRTRVSGKDLNIVLANAAIDNSELNGQSADDLTKRRARQNGLIFGVAR